MSLNWITEELRRLEAQGLRRRPVTLSSAQDAEVVIDGRRVVLLCSNNYLGLADDRRVRAAAADAAVRWGAGTGASRLVSGTTSLHRELEVALAAHKGARDCVLFSSGYLANVGTIAALAGTGDVVVSDELNHASIIDGCRISGARKVVYRHADASHLDEVLGATSGRRTLVVTDSVFSMDGDVAPLAEIADACARHGATLMVDEAHATGLLGPDGAGATFGLGVPVVMGTLSKSLGSAGGFICGSADLVEWLRNRARTHVFDTAPAPASIAAALAALAIVRAEPERRRRALEVAQTLAHEIRRLGFEVPEPAAAIVPVMVGEPADAVELSRRLLENGAFCPAIRPPTVPAGTARLRVTAMATHTDGHIDRALDAFARARGRTRKVPARSHRARGLFITGTDTGVGKTVVTAMIARALRSAGERVAVLKPAQTGGDDDAGFVSRAANTVAARTSFTLREPLAPAVAARLEGVQIDVETIVRDYERLAAHSDVVLVEGAGGITVPLTDQWTMGALATQLGLPVVVVARPGLGTINHTTLTVREARREGLDVVGVVISNLPRDPSLAEATNPREIERLAAVALAGVVPALDSVDVDAGMCPDVDPRAWLAPCLGGRFDRAAFLDSMEARRMHAART